MSAVGAVCGLEGAIFPECGCGPMLALYRAAGRFEERGETEPRSGDIVFYDWNGDGTPEHVGIVTGREGDTLTVAEGNYADKVGLRHVRADAPAILGCGKPDYLGASDYTPRGGLPEKESVPAEPEPEEREAALTLPYLRRGCRGETVRAAQLLLIGRGYRCGPSGADGDFGPATYGGVYAFQRGRRLEADGVIGPITWRALICG